MKISRKLEGWRKGRCKELPEIFWFYRISFKNSSSVSCSKQYFQTCSPLDQLTGGFTSTCRQRQWPSENNCSCPRQPPAQVRVGWLRQSSNPVRSHTLLTEWRLLHPHISHLLTFRTCICFLLKLDIFESTTSLSKALLTLSIPTIPSAAQIQGYILGGVWSQHILLLCKPFPEQLRKSPSFHSALCNSEGSSNTRQAPSGEVFLTYPRGAECWDK